MKINKGDYGYIAQRKKRMLLGTLLMAVCGVGVYIFGLLVNDMSRQNVFTVLGVLFALPGAKFLVGFIVTFPYHSVEEERYQRIKSKVLERSVLYTDLIITSAEKIMYLDFIIVGNGVVLALVTNEKMDVNYIRKYLTEGVNRWGQDYKVKVVASEKTFISEMNQVIPKEVDIEEEKNVNSFIQSLIV